MRSASRGGVLALLLLHALLLADVRALRFMIDRRECFSKEVKEEGAMVHASFVVVNAEPAWGGSFEAAGVDLTVEAPSGYHVYSVKQRTEEKFEFAAARAGEYKFCFSNNGPRHEKIDFEIHIGHRVLSHEEVAKDEHIEPLLKKITFLEETVMDLLYTSRFFYSHAARQAELAKITNRRLIIKTIVQSAALIATSGVQVYLLRRLFEKRLGMSRV